MVNRIKSVPMAFRHVEFGRDITACRAELKLTQSQVGELVNLANSCISDYETGTEPNPKIQNFLAICNLFDLDPRSYFELE